MGGVKGDITNLEIEKAFSKFGQVKKVQIVNDVITKQRIGFSFVNFYEISSCERAIKAGKVFIRGNRLNIKRCKPNLDYVLDLHISHCFYYNEDLSPGGCD